MEKVRFGLLPTENRVGDQHKYVEMFGRLNVAPVSSADLADTLVITGDNNTTYREVLNSGKSYILIESDVASMRHKRFFPHEQEMIENASGILCASEYHRDYLTAKYKTPHIEVVHLRPLAKDLEFDPLPKKENTIVYAGGINFDRSYTYRNYNLDIFPSLLSLGYEVHIYPAYAGRHNLIGYEELGCIVHDRVPQGDIYRELSQYMVGFHGYSKRCPQHYIKTVIPNKCWEYLAAGIPTLGYNAHAGGNIYNGKWGVVARTLDEIREAIESANRLDVNLFKEIEVIDNDLYKFERLLECV